MEEQNHYKNNHKSALKKGDTLEDVDIFNFRNIYVTLKRRKRIIIFSSLLSFFFVLIYTCQQSLFNSKYSGTFELLISDPVSKRKRPITDLGSKPDAIFDYVARSVDTLSNDIPTIIKYLESEKVIKELQTKYNIINYKEVLSNLRVEIINDNKKDFDQPPDVLKVSLRAKNPAKGIVILKAISDLYVESALNLRQQRLSEGLEFLNSQEPVLKENTEKLRNELALFRKKNNLLDPEIDARNLVENIEKIKIKIAKFKSEKNRLEIIKEEIKKGNLVSLGFQSNENEGSLAGGEGLLITASSQNLLKELFDIKNLYAEYLSKYKANSEIVLGLEKKINYLEPIVLKQQLELINSALELKKGLILNAEQQKKNLTESFSKKPKIISTYNTINKRLELAIEKEKALIKAKENFQLELNERSLPWLIIKEPKFGKNPVSPNISKYILFGMAMSIFLGTLIALIRDLTDNVFHDSELVGEFFEKKILTNLPYLENMANDKISLNQKIDHIFNQNIEKENDNFDGYKYFYYRESLRDLFTSITTDSLNQNIKFITTTSSIFGEGKTLLNSLIAKIFSDNNLKVLLIDADLRNPSIHKNFLIENKLGLSNLLSDKKLNLEKYLNFINPNLYIISAGNQNNNPTQILSSVEMDNFVNYLRESNSFDLVVFDTPPSLGLSDYKLITRNTDGLIFLVSLGYVKRSFAKTAFSEIKESNLNILGIITNSISENKSYNEINPIYKYYGNLYKNYSGSSTKESLDSTLNKESDNNLKNKIYSKVKKSFKSLKLLFKWLDG